MKSAAKAEIRARCEQKIDLRAITGEQAVYAVLDRALLWAERENSWGMNVWRGLIYVGTPCFMVTGTLWFFHAPIWAILTPVALGALLLTVLWIRDLLTLAHEGTEARLVASMTRAVQATHLNPPPANPDGEPTRPMEPAP
jgi:hypothetical protein